ncbi:MAG: hypothetical protein AAB820_02720 [Patescibacteria group bacterium]
MNAGWLRQNLLTAIFSLFIAGYALIIIISPALGPTDDFIFLRTLQSGEPILYYSADFPYYDTAGLGRFTPLAAMEYNFFGLFSSSPSPFWYYFFHAVQFALLIFLLIKILKHFTESRLLIYALTILISFLPAFTIPFFRLQMNERDVIFFLAAFLLCCLYYLKTQKTTYLALGVLFANLAIYYKETAFIAIGAFAFSYLLLSWRKSNLKTKFFNGLLLLSSFAYIAIYYFYIYLNLGETTYISAIYNKYLVLFKNIFNYTFFSDPIIILLLLPLTAWRAYKVFIKREETKPFYDSLLAAGSAYALAFFILNIYGPYYMLPAYIFAVPALIYFFGQPETKTFFWKGAIFLTALVLVFNTLPTGLHYLTYYKYLPINFNKTLDFLIQNISSEHPSERANIFMDGVDRATGRGAYFVLAEFLRFKGLSEKRFDLKSNVETENISPLESKIQFPFTVFQRDEIDTIKSGDYLIVSPQSTKINPSKNYLESLKKNYELVFQTRSPLAFPNINLKILVKYLLLKRMSQAQKSGGALINENLMNWPNYYVFVKK